MMTYTCIPRLVMPNFFYVSTFFQLPRIDGKPLKSKAPISFPQLFKVICDWLWQKQAVGLKISFVYFSLRLINNNFWLKCWKNYHSIFMGSSDMNSIMLFYSEV